MTVTRAMRIGAAAVVSAWAITSAVDVAAKPVARGKRIQARRSDAAAAPRLWVPLGGKLDTPGVSCVGRGKDGIECFGKASTGRLIRNSYDGRRWSGWKSHGGKLLGRPECIQLGGSKVGCLIQDARKPWLRLFYWDGKQWRWSTPKTSSGAPIHIDSAPSCVSNAWGHIHCGVLGKIHVNPRQARRVWYDGSQWHSQPAKAHEYKPPECVMGKNNQPTCFYHRKVTPQGILFVGKDVFDGKKWRWTDTTELPFGASMGADCVRTGSRTMECLLPGGGENARHARYTGTTWEYTELPIRLRSPKYSGWYSGPSCVRVPGRGDDTIDCYAATTGLEFVHVFQRGGSWIVEQLPAAERMQEPSCVRRGNTIMCVATKLVGHKRKPDHYYAPYAQIHRPQK